MTTHTISRPQVSTAFFGFVLIGVTSGAWGVLLPGISAYYGIDKAIAGLFFFASSLGYFLSAISTGWLISKIGQRHYLMLGATIFLLCCLLMVFKPLFFLVLLILLFQGMATGIIETGLNMFITSLPKSIGLLNYLHAFYGAGALVGPLIASTMLALSWSWNSTFFIWTLISLPLLLGLFKLFHDPSADPAHEEQRDKGASSLRMVLKLPIVWLATLFLLFYVGVEVSMGNWGYTLLLENRHQSELLAGWIASGYWLGLTLGRFLLNPIAERLHMSMSGLMYSCLVACLLSIGIIWLIPGDIACAAAFILLGIFLGPIYPGIVGLLPSLVPGHMLPNAMGFLVGLSIIGIALFPWLAGALAQYTSIWSLLPYTGVLLIITLIFWWTIQRKTKPINQIS
ncbi:MFS transporter [Dictyobacter arantiisoli]|uniref:MFS transporter n=1 Tax=Dictyobacter arantiisoli TaxID=2014874 RepID=A0A5A5TE62_9CHLR|nr:MFS transporter [Dictyobacter arantiisoli]GCF09528.1 MFS transporter [Dictyobacter arantiisoli]